MDGYVANWNRDYFIDKYARVLLKKMNPQKKEEFIYKALTDRLRLMSSLDLQDEINNYDPDIILGDID